MEASLKLLNQYVKVDDFSAQEIADQLTSIGHEVEGMHVFARGDKLVVGYVKEKVPHPDSDHLNICQVEVGNGVTQQIVCGAPNVAAGQKVIVALPGCDLGDGFKIKEAKIRGIESNGMICSIAELGIDQRLLREQDKAGIHVLDADAPVGEEALKYMGYDDTVLDIGLTPNRADCMAMIALAYEVGALLKRDVHVPEMKTLNELESDIEIDVQTDLCPCFGAKLVKGVTTKESPEWLRTFLMASGIKPINNIVDISNFVMLETGQPIHMYDYDKLKENNYNIVILNLRDMDKSEGWNPLEYPYNLYKNGDVDKAQEYLEKIGKIIFYENSSVDPFWSSTASDFFTGVTLALFEDGKQEEVNFNSVNNMFNGIDKKYGLSDYITTYFKSKDVTSKPYIFASTTFLAPKETKGSILSVARQKLRLYVSREKLSYLMNKTTFDFEDVASKPTAIILIARDENKTLNTLAAIFIEQLYAILLDKKAKVKFNFVLDNFDIIEKCNDLVDILGSCLSRNIKVYLATRSLEKISDEYKVSNK